MCVNVPYRWSICVYLHLKLITCDRAAAMEMPMTECREVQQGRVKKKIGFGEMFSALNPLTAVEEKSVGFSAMYLCL